MGSRVITEFSSSTLKRRMATVMFLDMVGFSALMSKDETLALECVRELHELLRLEVSSAQGRIVKLMGDGSMAEFPNAASAVTCAQNIQERIEARNIKTDSGRKFDVRIGLHLGELIEERGDLYGDSVNIAARVQPLADPGGIAMTVAVHNQLIDRPLPKGLFLPEAKLKNIPGKMPIFLVPPAAAVYPVWAFGRRGASWLFRGVAGAAAAIFLGATSYWINSLFNPAQMTLLFVMSPQGYAAQKAADDLAQDIMRKGKILESVHWNEQSNWRDFFKSRDIDLVTAFDRLDERVCRLLLERKIRYPVIGWIEPVDGGRWRVDLKIVDTKTRVVAGSFSMAGVDVRDLSEKSIDLIQAWLKKSI